MNEVILGSLVKIVKEDPIVSIQESEKGLEFFHMSGKKTTVVKEEVAPFDFSPIEESLKTNLAEIEEKLLKIVDRQPETVKEIVEPDYKAVVASLIEGYDYPSLIEERLTEGFSKLSDTFPEFLSPLYEKIDDWAVGITEKDVVGIVSSEIKKAIKKIRIPDVVDYSDKIESLEKKIEDIQPYVPHLEIIDNHLFITLPNGEKKDIGKFKQEHTQTMGVAGQDGKDGRQGLSAYEIAIKNGFIGSEQDWLDSLQGDYVPPQNGFITYDSEGLVSFITKGDQTTVFNRDIDGTIISIDKGSYIKQFLRDVQGRITGWEIIYK